MTKNAKATEAGKSDGSVAALLTDCRDYSDDFVRRRELTESDRPTYRTAWYESYRATQRAFRIPGAR